MLASGSSSASRKPAGAERSSVMPGPFPSSGLSPQATTPIVSAPLRYPDGDEVSEPQALEAVDAPLKRDRGHRTDAAAAHPHHLRWQDTRHAHRDRADAKLGRPCPPELRAQAVACDLRALCDAHAAPVGAHEDAVAGDDSLECAVVEVNEHVLSAHEHLVLADDDAFDSGGVTAPHDRAIPDAREDIERLVGRRHGVRDGDPGLHLVAGPAERAHPDLHVVTETPHPDRHDGAAVGVDLVRIRGHRRARHFADEGCHEQLALVDPCNLAHASPLIREDPDSRAHSPDRRAPARTARAGRK